MPALADFAAGMQAIERGDYSAAFKEFLPLANSGDPEAQVRLGLMYEHGQGVPMDYKQAVKWYRLAAEHGNSNAQNELGLMYVIGNGVLQDFKEAVRWYRVAAEQGNALAQLNLGFMYYAGEGVKEDSEEAFKMVPFGCWAGPAQGGVSSWNHVRFRPRRSAGQEGRAQVVPHGRCSWE
jgi:TPR repeat protein